MSTQILLEHLTLYRFDRPVDLGPHIIRLKPAPHCRTPILSYALSILPKKHFINWQQDPFGNYAARIVLTETCQELEVRVSLRVQMDRINPFDFFIEDDYLHYPFKYEKNLANDLRPYLVLDEKGPLLKKLARGFGRKKRHVVKMLSEVNQKINRLNHYLVRLESGVQKCEETLTLKSGSCRDLAWLACQVFRHMGIAARFASGYLIQLVSDEVPVSGPKGPEEDFTDLHAWVEVYLPGAGWVGLDPTSGLFAGEGHIPLSCTPHPSSAAPITGTVEPCETKLEHTMTLKRVLDPPRASLPLTPSQWEAVDRLGEVVDDRLRQLNVGLTMGGEPTFVSVDNRDDPQWVTGALGDEKFKKGWEMLTRLRTRFSPGSLAQAGQGKWYGGEPLPRWSLNSIWRPDGEPVWTQENLLSDPTVPGQMPPNSAKALLNKLAQDLGLPPSRILPAYESDLEIPALAAVSPASIPPPEVQSPPGESERKRRPKKSKKEEAPLIAGWVLPVTWSLTQEGWVSETWRFERDSPAQGRVLLFEGDSPLGYRLPLNDLPQGKPLETVPFPRDTFENLPPLPPHKKLSAIPPSAYPEAKGAVRTALCVQCREGKLYIFLPPLALLEHYLELVAKVEAAAAALHLSVVLEGYEPPVDSRLMSFRITPDPGVLEVNIHPAQDWAHLRDNTEILYEEARQIGLTAVKFTVNGRPVGTGGGSHLVLGAARPEQSPFFRQPRLLPAMIAYWQRHPSLSYFFTSLFVGPTSQAPRPDEARHDSLYELENAMRRVPTEGDLPFWRLDRLFRHLLVDVSGNTHRTEFCIDKLYDPSSGRGRQGLLELRAFEMAPNPRMALLQQLLVRALVARLYRAPLQTSLVRWGTRLHDQYLLPWYLWEDLSHVLEDLHRDGFTFELEWFRAHFNFRFPLCGRVVIEGAVLEIRPALEPWPVLGEEAVTSTVSRAVDASTERVQVIVKDARPGLVLSCNGRRVPLMPTTTPGVQVAGIRYKAWDQPLSLYGDVPAVPFLELDLIDPALEISLGGCALHTFHPGGRSFDLTPINAEEAESRWKSRFEPHGRATGRMAAPPEEPSHDFPHTLDLRRPREF